MARDLADNYHLGFYDASIVASALLAGCNVVMTTNTDIAAAIEHLDNFLDKSDWGPRLAGAREAMLDPVLADSQVDIAELFVTLEEHGLLGSFAAYVDEASFCVRLEPDGANLIDAYLKRRGWQETPRARAYLQAMRDSTPAVWEVRATQPGAWVEVVDRLGDGTVLRVAERSASQSLQRYDRLVARLVPVRDVNMFTGGVLMLTHDTADRLEAALRHLAKEGKATREAVTAACVRLWTNSVLQAVRRAPPELRTTHGEPLLLGRTRLLLSAGVSPTEIERRLDAAGPQGWVRTGGVDEPGWLWFGADGASEDEGTTPASDTGSGVRAETSQTIIATMRADGAEAFVVETMSKARMERALESLEALLAGLLTRGLTSYEDPLQALPAHRERGKSASPGAADTAPGSVDDGIDPEIAADIVHQVTDAHYRRTLDEAVPMLGNRTPRECTRTKAGRKKLVAWLKFLENAELHRVSGLAVAPYDFGWMWRELGVEDER